MIESIFAPVHACSLETLLDEPPARTLDHPFAAGKSEFLEPEIVDVLTVLLKILVEFGKLTYLRGAVLMVCVESFGGWIC
jgi:hypothetical protein